jgi:hypothetical protein
VDMAGAAAGIESSSCLFWVKSPVMSPSNRATRSTATSDVASPVDQPAERRTGAGSGAAESVKSRRDSICGRSFSNPTANRKESRSNRQDSQEARCASTSRRSDAETWPSM